MLRRKLPFFLASLLAWPAVPCHLQAESVTLRPVADTTLFETNPLNNLGGHTDVAAGTTRAGFKSRGLFQFDPARQIPPTATITKVMLNLVVTRSPSSAGTGSSFDLRRVLKVWGEGDKAGNIGAEATVNEASWLARLAPSILWQAPGGGIPGDFSDTVSAAISIAGAGEYAFASSSNLVADVQFWLANPELNFGWVMMSQNDAVPETARRIGSREDPSNAPSLNVEYALEKGPFRFASITREGTRLVLNWTGGKPPYQMQKVPSLTFTNWANAGELLNTNVAILDMEGNQGFYRVTSE